MTVARDVHFQAGRQCVNDRNPHAVQTAADVIAAVLAAELAAGVELGHHDVDGRCSTRMHLDGDSAAVVTNLDPTVIEHPHVDFGRVSGHCFVDRVIDDLPHEVVQTTLAGGADVHAGTFADGLQTFENSDGIGVVRRLGALLSGRRSLLSGRHGRQHLLGGRSGGVGTAGKSRVHSTGNWRQDRFCGGVSSHLTPPCVDYLGQR